MAAGHENPSVSPQATYWDQNRQASPLSADSHTIGSHTVGRLSADNINPSLPPSNNDYRGYDGVASPGSESVYTEKLKPAAVTHVDDAPGNTHPPVDKRICGIRKAWFLLVLIAATCVAIAVGVALGVTLARKNKSDGSKAPQNSSSSSNQSGGQSSQPINPAYLSTSGVFNGTGIALAGESFDSGVKSQTVLYFQHWTGQIRQTTFLDDGTWSGGDVSEIVAVDAKNATPISMVSYSVNGTNTWHMFYIGKNNTILERVNSNNTLVWRDGPLGQLGLLALDDRNVGLQGCWYGDYYGASTRSGNATNAQQIGLHLWYGSAANKIDELTFVYGSNQWVTESPILGYNGHAGIGCYSWGGGSVTYLMLVNPQNQVEILWKELNSTIKSTPTHPLNTWTSAKGATFPTVTANTSLGYTVWFFMQNADYTVSGHNISWAAENTTIFNKDGGGKDSFTISESTGKPSQGLPGTHLSVTALPTKSHGANEYVFFQTDSSNITEFSRDLSSGVGWFSSSVAIPYT